MCLKGYVYDKTCTDGLLYPLIIILNLSLRTNTFPDVWKQIEIISVFKKGATNNCKKFRSIAILSPFSKVFEIIMHKRFFNKQKI